VLLRILVAGLGGLRRGSGAEFSFIVRAAAADYALSLHDALPIFQLQGVHHRLAMPEAGEYIQPGGDVLQIEQHRAVAVRRLVDPDRKSTRLNSSHVKISYAVFCLKKKSSIANWMSKALSVE